MVSPISLISPTKTEGHKSSGVSSEQNVRPPQPDYSPIIAPIHSYQIAAAYKLQKVTKGMFPKNEYEGRVLKVVDGDSIHVHIKAHGKDYYVRVRYIGISAPEVSNFGKEAEPYSREATEANRKLVEGRTVKLKLDSRKKYDSGRLLAYVYVEIMEDGEKKEIFVNNYLVRYGFVRVKIYYPQTAEDKEIKELIESEEKAKEEKSGLWGIE